MLGVQSTDIDELPLHVTGSPISEEPIWYCESGKACDHWWPAHVVSGPVRPRWTNTMYRRSNSTNICRKRKWVRNLLLRKCLQPIRIKYTTFAASHVQWKRAAVYLEAKSTFGYCKLRFVLQVQGTDMGALPQVVPRNSS